MLSTQYNAKDCVITVDDVYITGVGTSMVTGTKDEQMFSTTVGAQGDVCMNETNNPLGTITITVQATSPQKPYLIDLAKSGKVVSIWVVNKSLRERMGGTQARIKNYPSMDQADTVSDRAFEFQVFDYLVENTD